MDCRLSSCLFAATAALAPAPALAQLPDKLLADIDALVTPLVEAELYVGMSIGLVKRKIVVYRGYGAIAYIDDGVA